MAVPDAEEIVQEVFLSLFQHLREGKSRANLQGWIFKVAHNLALKSRMKAQRQSPAAPETQVDLRRARNNKWRICRDSTACWPW